MIENIKAIALYPPIDYISLPSGYNPLSEIPSTVITGLTNLEKFYCSGCNLGGTLSSGLLVFRSKTLRLVSLWKNGISRLDPGAIVGTIPFIHPLPRISISQRVGLRLVISRILNLSTSLHMQRMDLCVPALYLTALLRRNRFYVHLWDIYRLTE